MSDYYHTMLPNQTRLMCCCSELLHTCCNINLVLPSAKWTPPFVLRCLGWQKYRLIVWKQRDFNQHVLIPICSRGGWVWGLKAREPCLWAFCSRRKGGADEWRVRFQHHKTLNGLVTVPVQCASFPTGWFSHPLRYSILRLSSAADSCRGCEEERGKAPHPHSSCWGKWGTSRAETGNLMIDAVSESSKRLPHFPCASPGSLSVMMRWGRAQTSSSDYVRSQSGTCESGMENANVLLCFGTLCFAICIKGRWNVSTLAQQVHMLLTFLCVCSIFLCGLSF